MQLLSWKWGFYSQLHCLIERQLTQHERVCNLSGVGLIYFLSETKTFQSQFTKHDFYVFMHVDRNVYNSEKSNDQNWIVALEEQN